MNNTFVLIERSFKNLLELLNYKNYGNSSRILHWGKLIGVTGTAQLLVQAVGFISGILIIRLLPVEEYALYTLANTMLGTMTLLADGGVSAGVMSQGGKVWQDRSKLGKVLSTGLELRKKFAVVSLIFSIPILAYLLLHHDASILMTVLIVSSLVPAFYAQLSDAILIVVPKLHQDIKSIQKNEVLVGLGRLLLTIVLVFLFPFTFLALLANGLPRIYGNIKLKKIAEPFADLTTTTDVEVRQNILHTVKRLLPGIIYFCLSGQITIWLISVFGSTTALAQLGALGRLAMLLSLFNGLIGMLIIPRYARLIEQKKLLSTFYIRVLSGVSILMVGVIGAVYLFPGQLLWVLGDNYENLQLELVLAITGSAISLVAGVAFSLNVSRDWVVNPALSIFISLLSIVAGILLFDISNLTGVLVYNIFLAAVQFVLNSSYSFFKLKTL